MQKQAKYYYHAACPALVSTTTWNKGRRALLDETAMKYLVGKRKICTRFFICFCLLMLPLLSAGAQEIGFTDVLITNNAGQIIVYAQATDCVTKSTEAAILAGVPTTLIFYLDFYQARPYWWDKRLARSIIKHTIKYDNVEKNFHISSTNGQHESATFQSFQKAKTALAELNGVAVYPLKALAKDKFYYLKMKAAKKDQRHLPMHMEYSSFFTFFGDFGMGWRKEKISDRRLTAP